MSLHEDPIDVLARLDAMRVQEATALAARRHRSPLRPSVDDATVDSAAAVSAGGEELIDASSRAAMAAWLSQIQSALRLSPDTAWRALAMFDRYLASGRGRSREVLTSKCHYQLAAIAAFYTCIKVHEPAILDAGMMCKICRGTYVEKDVTDMEMDILQALEWRVATHTPLEFVHEALRLLPGTADARALEEVLRSCQWHLDRALADADLSAARPSVLGLAALACSLAESDGLSLPQKRAVWTAVSDPFVESSEEVVAAQDRLLSLASPCPSEPGRLSGSFRKAQDASYSRQCSAELRNSFNGKSSPVSVTAPQA